ncbi:proline-rich protein 2-like [Sorex araneus]|uniref:proline-rich protein 2-like n=1 Tax=Sorex araneus TaxID=42254 RepID=UPI0024339CD9|nr:proline-rich protein 2-like [Sorex araneus]
MTQVPTAPRAHLRTPLTRRRVRRGYPRTWGVCVSPPPSPGDPPPRGPRALSRWSPVEGGGREGARHPDPAPPTGAPGACQGAGVGSPLPPAPYLARPSPRVPEAGGAGPRGQSGAALGPGGGEGRALCGLPPAPPPPSPGASSGWDGGGEGACAARLPPPPARAAARPPRLPRGRTARRSRAPAGPESFSGPDSRGRVLSCTPGRHPPGDPAHCTPPPPPARPCLASPLPPAAPPAAPPGKPCPAELPPRPPPGPAGSPPDPTRSRRLRDRRGPPRRAWAPSPVRGLLAGPGAERRGDGCPELPDLRPEKDGQAGQQRGTSGSGSDGDQLRPSQACPCVESIEACLEPMRKIELDWSLIFGSYAGAALCCIYSTWCWYL